ncbi:MAG: hypothetical protein IPL16_01070 [Ignavibacteria bacterium]|nr:hypothetical protein [Ignavibacteria bacterium]
MSDDTKPTNETEFEKNFEQINPLMNSTQAYCEFEIRFCYDACAVNACPTRIDIPLFIRQINLGNSPAPLKRSMNQIYFSLRGKGLSLRTCFAKALMFTIFRKYGDRFERLQSFETFDRNQ